MIILRLYTQSFLFEKRRKIAMDLDKLIQNYEDIIEISKQTTADLEKL